MTAGTTPGPIRVLDLTIDQIERIERESGVPLDKWQSPPSRMALFRKIYSVVRDVPDEAVGHMTLREITDAITFNEGDGDEADPTVPRRRTGSRR